MPSLGLAYPSSVPQGGAAPLSLAVLSERSHVVAELREDAMALGLRAEAGAPKDAETWPATWAWMVWRLHPAAAVPDLLARARSSKLSLADRKLAMDTGRPIGAVAQDLIAFSNVLKGGGS